MFGYGSRIVPADAGKGIRGFMIEAGKADAENAEETEVFPPAQFDCDLWYAHITNTIPQIYNTAIILYSPYS